MSTIDTVEEMQELAKYWLDFGSPETSAMFTRYAALLEAVNRPVNSEDVARANAAYIDAFRTRENRMQSALKAHMAALREEVRQSSQRRKEFPDVLE